MNTILTKQVSIKPMLEMFLKSNGISGNFNVAICEQRGMAYEKAMEEFVAVLANEPVAEIFESAFTWRSTSEGFDFWKRKSELWKSLWK